MYLLAKSFEIAAVYRSCTYGLYLRGYGRKPKTCELITAAAKVSR